MFLKLWQTWCFFTGHVTRHAEREVGSGPTDFTENIAAGVGSSVSALQKLHGSILLITSWPFLSINQGQHYKFERKKEDIDHNGGWTSDIRITILCSTHWAIQLVVGVDHFMTVVSMPLQGGGGRVSVKNPQRIFFLHEVKDGSLIFCNMCDDERKVSNQVWGR